MSSTQQTTQIINLPAKKALGVRRNQVSLIAAEFPKWEKEASQIFSEILGKESTTRICSYPRYVSPQDSDVEHLLFFDSIDSYLVEKVNKFQQSISNGLIVQVSDIPSGEYAYVRHVGPYDGVGQVWSNLANEKFTDFTLGDPSWEEYVNDDRSVPKEELITDVYWKLNNITKN